MTLVNKLRQMLSIEGDEYFSDEILVNYINKAEQFVVNLFIEREKSGGVSVRVLDKLRTQKPFTVAGDSLTYTAVGSYYSVDLGAPTDMLEQISLDVNFTTILRELTYNTLYKLAYSNAVPSLAEGYYTVVNSGANKKIRVFHVNNTNTNVFNLYYIKNLTAIDEDSTALLNVASQLENAVMYYAAYLTLTQENIRESANQNQAKEFFQVFSSEIQNIRY